MKDMVEEQIDYFSQIQNYDRELYTKGETSNGNTVVFIGGIHGNEPAGVVALQDVFQVIDKYQIPLYGKIRAISGNIEALKAQTRQIDIDLNRVWTRENIDKLHYNRLDQSVVEYKAMSDIYGIIQEEIHATDNQLFILDLHTTSAPSVSFSVTNIKSECMEFVRQYPFPSISGLTGFLDGTLLSYINDIGHVGLAYEAGMHRTENSLEKHRSFVWYSLVKTGIVKEEDLPFALDYHEHNLGRDWSSELPHSFKIISRYKISDNEGFKMEEGYDNFQRIRAGEILASNKEGEILSPYDGHIFMPLYQEEGEDGFFIVKPVDGLTV